MKNISSKVNQKDLRKDQITLLVTTYYDKYDFLRYEPLSLLIDKALSIFLDSNLSIEEINTKIMDAVVSRKKALDERYNSKNVLKNHEILYGRLEQVTRLMNEAGIDYYLAGALTGYIKYDEESDRCHDDIDFMINEKDLDAFRKVILDIGFFYEDSRIPSPRVLKNGIPSGEHEVIARDPNSDFHIGVFCFERLKNKTIISKGYYHDEDGNDCCREEVFSPKLASIVFHGEEVEFRNTPIRIIAPEYVYQLKNYTRHQKDLHDIQFLKTRIQMEIVGKIEELSRTDREVRYVSAKPVASKKRKDDLGLMLVDDEPKEKNSSKQKCKTKKNEEGFISDAIITSLALLTFSLSFIGLAVIYLLVH